MKVTFDEFLEKQVNEIAAEPLLNAKTKYSKKVFISCVDSAKRVAYEITFRALLEEYQIMRKSGSLSGITRVERMAYFEKHICSDSFAKLFFEKYELIYPILHEQVNNAIRHILEVADHYKSDQTTLSLLFSTYFGEIEAIFCPHSDIRDGRGVSIVALSNVDLVYKPRNLNNDSLFYSLLESVSYNMNVENYIPKSLSRSTYGWQEFISHKECETLDQVKKYYERSGILLALLYLLCSFDINCENIICNGEYPVITDLETLTMLSTMETPYRDINNSVINTGLIPHINENGVFDNYLSAVFVQQSDIGGVLKDYIVEDNELDWSYDTFLTDRLKNTNTVLLEGEEIDFGLVAEDFKNGFRNALVCVLENKDFYKSFVVDYLDSHDLCLRQILRPTKVYYDFIQESYHPKYLTSSDSQDNLFNILVDSFQVPEQGFNRVANEIFYMKQGNVPLYYAKHNDRSLYVNKTVLHKNYFSETCMVRIMQKFDNLTHKEIDFQIRFIEASIISVMDAESEDFCIKKNLRKLPIALDSAEVAFSTYIEKQLLANEVEITSKESSFYLLSKNKDKRFYISPLNCDLYQGGGIVWTLAAWGKHFKNSEILDYSERLLNNLLISNNVTESKSKQSLNISVYAGKAGLLYLSYNFYKLLGKNKYLYNAELIFNDLMTTLLMQKSFDVLDLDFMTGLSSTIYLLSIIYLDNPSITRREDIMVISDKYFTCASSADLRKIGLAHGISGVTLTLSMLYRITQNKKYLKSIIKYSSLEQSLIKKYNSVSWCRGIGGITLALYYINKNIENVSDSSQIFNTMEYMQGRLISSKHDLFEGDKLCLCHGIYGSIDIIKTIFNKPLNNPFLKETEMQYFKSWEDLCWLPPINYRLDGFMLGISGIVYTALRNENPELPSLLGLELYNNLKSK